VLCGATTILDEAAVGLSWSKVEALFELLRQLAALYPDFQVKLDEGILPEAEQAIVAVWSMCCRRSNTF
jgi:hypothetical protein